MSEFVDRAKDYFTTDRSRNQTNHYRRYNSKFRYSPRQNYHKNHYRKFYCKKKRDKYFKKPSRPPSPLCGTEEYTQKKIQETSDMIKKQLMMSFELINNKPHNHDNCKDDDDKKNDTNLENTNNLSVSNSAIITKKSTKAQQKKTIIEEYDVNQIHDKIINHISSLSYAKKVNLIRSTSSGYDAAIQQIQKQKRLELSKALRDMCSEKTINNTELINSIIPDIGIRIEQLPVEIIEELSKTLDLSFDYIDGCTPNFDYNSVEENRNFIKSEIIIDEKPNFDYNPVEDNKNFSIKSEIIVDEKLENPDENLKTELDEINMKTEIDENFEHNTPSGGLLKSQECLNQNSQQFLSIKTNLFENKSNVEKPIESSDKFIQTELDFSHFQLSEINENNLLTSTTTLTQAIQTMDRIDKEILRLTKLRQQIFHNLEEKQDNPEKRRKFSQIKHDDIEENRDLSQINVEYDRELSLGNLTEKILIIRVIRNNLIVVGAESGNLVFIDLKSDRILKRIQISSTPITSIILYSCNDHLFIGALESTIFEYDSLAKNLIGFIPISNGCQCLEISWNYLFIGTNNGNLIRYSIQKNRIEFEENISMANILVLKATQEGARKVLLIGTRNSPICVRDALSGLHMRTMNALISPTVYSLLLDNSLVYCGTTTHDILVFGFHDGNLLHKYNASNSKGIGCMKIVGDLLFASCYNGNIYVYYKKTHEFIGNIQGPGGVVLSMEIVGNLVIVGTICFKFKSILIPDFILKYNRL